LKRWKPGINLLALLAGLTMAVAMLFPWWSYQLAYSPRTDLYPYLLSGPASEFLGYKRSPQMALLSGILFVSILMCFIGGLWRGWGGRITLGASSLLVALAIWRLLVRIENVTDRFHVPLQGKAIGSLDGFAAVEVTTWFRPGLYLIVIGCILALLAGLFHSKLWVRINGWGE
jgi:hypothetical protein